VEELYVVPDRRGEGHGRMLMETALALARERGATTVELATAADDLRRAGCTRALGSRTSRMREGPRRRCSTTSASCEGHYVGEHGGYVGELELDDDGFVLLYLELARRAE